MWREKERKPSRLPKRTIKKTETKGEMTYNPLTGKYEWKETTRHSPNSVPTLPGLTSARYCVPVWSLLG